VSEQNETLIRRWFEEAGNEFDFLNMYQQLGALSLADPGI
jgi:hypothetical protein